MKLHSSLNNFKVWLCPSCGNWQVTEAVNAPRCRLCGKTTPFRRDGMWNVKVHSFTTFEEAYQACRDLKMKTEPKPKTTFDLK